MAKLPNLTFSQERASKIADMLGWAEEVSLCDVVGILINAMHRIDYLERRVAQLRTPAQLQAESEADIALADAAAAGFGPDDLGSDDLEEESSS